MMSLKVSQHILFDGQQFG